LRELHDQYHLSRAGLLPGGTQTGLGLGATGSLSCSFGGPFRVGPEGVDLDLGCHPGDRPIARAMPEHGKALSDNLSKASLSTRELALFFQPLPEGQS